ncbi:FAD-dependent oxidoreductase [Aureimonas altamirensis]|uniref:FAD-dependent oxidoreductase n=1 Tax=Aureimonas altamirensis TaxID=370622 RepID=UPI00301AD122
MHDIAIVGAGIAGLTTALCLARAGFRVRVFERAAAAQPVGAGIQLSPNALRVMARLGCLEALVARGTLATAVTLRDGRTGRTLADVPVQAADGTPYLSIHRADLHSVLLDAALADAAISVSFGHTLTALNETEAGIGLRFGADEHVFQLLVAADGVGSAIAAGLGFASPGRSPYAAWRFLRPAGNGETSGIEAWLDARWHAVTYPVHAGGSRNLVVIARTDFVEPDDGSPARLAAALSGRAAPGLLETINGGTSVGCWPMSAVPPARPYANGNRIVLVGDAAHGMLPFAAQGAAMGIEDAAVLAACLADGVPNPLTRYEALRRPRITRVLKRVRFHDRVYHLPRPFSLARDAVMRLTPPARLAASLSWLYDWAPPELPGSAFETSQRNAS